MERYDAMNAIELTATGMKICEGLDSESCRIELVAELGDTALGALRRQYFPRWRPSSSGDVEPELRRLRRVIVSDEREATLVRAIAPPNVRVRILTQP
jgi:hypothetical protein